MKNNSNKNFIRPILVVLAILFVFTGCGNTATSSETPATTEAPAVTETPVVTETPATPEAPATWTVNADKSISTPSGKMFYFEECFNGYEISIISAHKDRALLKMSKIYPEYGVKVLVADDSTGKVHYLSSTVYTILDVANAYDTVYWFTSDREVWACHWYCSYGKCKEICAPVLFCEGALALSPYADESEGAIVSNGSGNWEYVDGLHILSPYGEGGEFKNPEPCRNK